MCASAEKLYEGPIWGIHANPSFQPQCFLRPISEIGVRHRGTVFISSSITLHHTEPLASPSTLTAVKTVFYSLELYTETDKKKTDKKKCTYTHTGRDNTNKKTLCYNT